MVLNFLQTESITMNEANIIPLRDRAFPENVWFFSYRIVANKIRILIPDLLSSAPKTWGTEAPRAAKATFSRREHPHHQQVSRSPFQFRKPPVNYGNKRPVAELRAAGCTLEAISHRRRERS